MLFDLKTDPNEMIDLSQSADHAATLKDLTAMLMQELYGGDEEWVVEGKLEGLPSKPFRQAGNRTLSAQRGSHWPPAPQVDIPQIEWNPTVSK